MIWRMANDNFIIVILFNIMATQRKSNRQSTYNRCTNEWAERILLPIEGL